MPGPSAPPETFPVAAAPSQNGSITTVRLLPTFVWLTSAAAGPLRDAAVVVRDAEGKSLTAVPMRPPGATTSVDLRHLAPGDVHEIAHEKQETSIAPKLAFRPGDLRACLGRGDAAGAVAAIRLVWPQEKSEG